MPIYEFYCPDCHMLFSFLSRKVAPDKRPGCPRCRRRTLEKQVSAFAMTGRAKEGGEGMDDLPIDESRMEQAMTALAGEAEGLNEDDPRQAAQLMRKFSRMTGLEFGNGINEAIGRMEAGEDPEKIESEMGDALDTDDPFVLPGRKGGGAGGRRGGPARDATLYEM